MSVVDGKGRRRFLGVEALILARRGACIELAGREGVLERAHVILHQHMQLGKVKTCEGGDDHRNLVPSAASSKCPPPPALIPRTALQPRSRLSALLQLINVSTCNVFSARKYHFCFGLSHPPLLGNPSAWEAADVQAKLPALSQPNGPMAGIKRLRSSLTKGVSGNNLPQW